MRQISDRIVSALAEPIGAYVDRWLSAPFPPDLPSDWRAMFEDGRPLASWEEHARSRFDQQRGEARYEVVRVDEGSPLPSAFRAWLESASREATGLRGVCPACDRAVRGSASGFVSNRFEYRAFRCCDRAFYLISCFRRRGDYCLAVIEPERARLHLRPGRILLETGADTLFVEALLCFKERAVEVAMEAAGSGASDRAPTGPHPASLVLGRGDANPGHVLFQDLALIVRRLDGHPADAAPLRIYVPYEGQWYMPLLEEVVGGRRAEILRFRASFDRMSSSLAREGQYVENDVIEESWPASRSHSAETDRIVHACAVLAARGTSAFELGTCNGRHAADGAEARIVLHARFGSRRWAPVGESIAAFRDRLAERMGRVQLVVHAEGGAESADAHAVRSLCESRSDMALLLDPSIETLLATVGDSDLCVGPIGSGFWWAGLLDVSALTLHPHGDRSNIIIYEWIAAPPAGEAPPFLRLLDRARFRCLEEPPRATPRVPFEDLQVDPLRVADEAISLLAAPPQRPARARAEAAYGLT